MKYCPECGAALKDKAIYCTNCGAKLDPKKVIRQAPAHTTATPQIPPKQSFHFNDETFVETKPLLKRENVKAKVEVKKEEPLPIEEKPHSLFGFVIIAVFLAFVVAGASAFLIPYITTSHHAAVEKAQEASAAKAANDYILATSSSVELTTDDLDGLSQKQLHYAKNEIYARNGYIFSNSDLSSYFKKKDWYVERIKQSDATTDQTTVYNRMSKIEKYNIAFILKYGKNKGWSV